MFPVFVLLLLVCSTTDASFLVGDETRCDIVAKINFLDSATDTGKCKALQTCEGMMPDNMIKALHECRKNALGRPTYNCDTDKPVYKDKDTFNKIYDCMSVKVPQITDGADRKKMQAFQDCTANAAEGKAPPTPAPTQAAPPKPPNKKPKKKASARARAEAKAGAKAVAKARAKAAAKAKDLSRG